MCGQRVEHRIQEQSQRDGSLTSGWVKKWNLHSRTENPPFPERIPASLEYIRNYIVDVAYIPRQGGSETAKAYWKRLYTTLQALHNASFTPQEMRIARLWPQSDWQTIWKNLITAPISEADKAVWYRTIHDIFPTNERLHQMKMSPTDNCKECVNKDTLLHRLTECGEGHSMWEWTREIIARMLRNDPGENPQRMAVAPTILPLASATSSCGTMGVIPICNIPNKPPTRPDATRLNGLSETI